MLHDPPERADAALRLRVLQYPHYTSNSYQAELARGLAEFGVETSFCRARWSLRDTVIDVAPDVLHIHWIDEQIGPRTTGNVRKFVGFVRGLLAARRRGARVIWTAHNAQSHWPKSPLFDWLFSFATGSIAHRVIAHGPQSADLVRRRFLIPRRKVVVIPHWNYAAEIERCPVRPASGRRRFLGFGQIRASKGFGDLAELFARERPGGELRIAGDPRDEEEARRILGVSETTPDVSAKMEFLSSEELRQELCASTFVVLPYRRILTSGSLLMSLTAGRPVIAPRLGDMATLVNEETAILYDPGDPEGLSKAIRKAIALDPARIETMQEAAWRLGQDYPLSRSARATFDTYRLVPPGQVRS